MAQMGNKRRLGTKHSQETKDKMSASRSGINHPMFGKRFSAEWKRKLSESAKKDRILRHTPEYLARQSAAAKIAMHRPDIRKRHIDGILSSPWSGGVRTDNGQIELLSKWNRLGFNFEINYQFHTDLDLFYLDGYDTAKNVVFEYDSKYHSKAFQKQKDLIRQNKVIDLLNPVAFWRYDSTSKKFKNVIERRS